MYKLGKEGKFTKIKTTKPKEDNVIKKYESKIEELNKTIKGYESEIEEFDKTIKEKDEIISNLTNEVNELKNKS